MAMNKQRRTANLNNILTYDSVGNSTLIANLTIEGLTGAGFVKADANGLLSVDTAAYTVTTGTTNYLTKITAANTLGQSLVFDNGTSVLVNTASLIDGAGHAFQVLANASGGMIISTTDVASALAIINSSSGNKTWDISPYGNHLVINESNVATRMKFDAGGNITIGDITNTGHKLEIVGSFRTTGTNTLSQLQGVGDRMVVANTNGVLSTQAIPTGSITGSGAAGQVNFWTGTNTVSGSNNLFWDNANTSLLIGTDSIVNAFGHKIRAVGTSDASIGIFRNHESQFASKLEFFKSRGTYAAPTALIAGDVISNITSFGWGTSSVQYVNAARIEVVANTIGATGVEGKINFFTFNNAGGNLGNLSLLNSAAAPGSGAVTVISGGLANTITAPLGTLHIRGVNAANTDNAIYIENSTPTPMFVVRNDGNVGIGTNAPASPLHISGSGTGAAGRTWLRVQNTSANSGSGVQLYNASNRFAYMQYTASSYGIGEVLSFFTDSDYPVLFATNGISTSGGTSHIAFSPGGYANEAVRFTGAKNVLIGTTTDGGQRLQVIGDTLLRGSGNTSATTALTVQNSDGTNMLRVSNNNLVFLQNIFPLAASSLGIYHRENINGGIVFAPNGATTLTSGARYTVITNETFTPTSGNASFATQLFQPTINQTGGANGVTRGLYIIPTLTSAADWRSIQWDNNTGWGLYGAGTADSYLAGRLLVRTNTNLAGYGHAFQVLANAAGGMVVSTTDTASAIAIVNSSSTNKTWDISPFGNNLSINESGIDSRMYFAAGGNVLIGGIIDDAVNKLQVNGDAKVTGNLTTNVISSLLKTNASGVLTAAVAGTDYQTPIANPVTGTSIGAGRVAYWTGTSSLAAGTDLHWDNTSGSLSIGNNSAFAKLYIAGSTTSTTTQNLVWASTSINTTLTNVFSFRSNIGGTANPNTATNIYHFLGQHNAFLSTTVTNQYVFYADGITGATNNYGFYGNLSAGANKWNLYMNGTAANYINGTTLIGTSTDDGVNKLQVAGSIASAGIMRSDASRTAAINDVSIALLGSNITTYAAGFSMNAAGYGLNAIYAQHEQRFGGNATFSEANLNGGGLILNKLAPTAAGTVTMNQPSGKVRTMSNLHLQTQIQGNNNLTVTHMSGLHIYGHYRTSGTGTLTVSNAYYGVFLADPNEFGTGATVTGSNYGFYQQGADPYNYFGGKVSIGTTATDGTSKLRISGLPTSSAGLLTGEVWSNGGVLTIV